MSGLFVWISQDVFFCCTLFRLPAYTEVRKHRTIVSWAHAGNDAMVLPQKRSVVHRVLPAIFDWYVLPRTGNWHTDGKYLSCILVFAVSQCDTDCTWCTVTETIGGIRMKVVIWKSPRYLCGMLRRMFGIRNDE